MAPLTPFFERLLEIILNDTRDNRILVCTKCGVEQGTLFCDRSLLGEIGACDFKPKRVTNGTDN